MIFCYSPVANPFWMKKGLQAGKQMPACSTKFAPEERAGSFMRTNKKKRTIWIAWFFLLLSY